MAAPERERRSLDREAVATLAHLDSIVGRLERLTGRLETYVETAPPSTKEGPRDPAHPA